MTPPPLVDAEARRVVRQEVTRTVVVEAAAGTGKTTELVARIVETLKHGGDVGRIAVVTFTEKAAGELKLRLRAELERARRTPGEHLAIEDAVLRLEEAKIATLHAFCADLLRERPLEAGVDPAFEALAEDESEDLFAEIFEGWFEGALAAPGAALRRALRRRSEDGPVAALRVAARELARHADLDAPWTSPVWDREAATLRVLDAARELLGCAQQASSAALRDHVARVSELGAIAETRDGTTAVDDLEAAIAALVRHPKLFRDPPRAGGQGAALVLDALGAFEREARAFADLADGELAAALREELRPVVHAYAEAKAERGVLDFDDLLLAALTLLTRSPAGRAALQRRFDRLFVDEFQDTDAVQAAILLLLSADDPHVSDPALARPIPGKLFVVGDPKQSIYRFRRADLGTYFAVTERLANAGAARVELRASFRAVPSIQAVVNTAFSAVLVEDRDSLQPGYVALERTGAEEPADQPAVVALPVPHPYGARGRLTLTAVRASQPQAVGAFVAWLLHESGWKVRDPASGERVPVAPRHVCLLFRHLDTRWQGDLGSTFAAALTARDVPVVLVGGKALFDREESLALVAAACAIERPGDLHDVYLTLRGPLFALTDDVLVDYRGRYGLHPLRPPVTALPQHLESVAEVLALLAELHWGRLRRTPAETLERLLTKARAHVGFALRPSGEQVLANVAAVLEVARRQEQRGALSFGAFVDRLRDEVVRRRSPEPPILEEESDGVRVMTVHKAKGLEFPVVVLADPTPNASPQAAWRVVDPEAGRIAFRVSGALPLDVLQGDARELRRERAESARLAYVAATRARDLLVVPVVGDSPVFPADGWLAPLQRALVPPEGERPAPSPGCPHFGRDAVVRGDDNVPGPPEGALVPGTYEAPGGARWTVWDPGVLKLRPPRAKGLRRVDLVGIEGAEADVVAAGHGRLDRFLADRAADVARASVPSERVVTPSTVSHASPASDGPPAGSADPFAPVPDAPWGGAPVVDAPEEAAAVTVERVEREAGRPTGRHFGELVHRLLEMAKPHGSVDLTAEALVRARLLGLDAEAAAAAVRAAKSALAHPILQAAARATARGECRREAPITHVLQDGYVLEGVVDLAYREAGVWTVVDFKTDAHLDEVRRAAYARQVGLYTRAIAAATGQATRGVLLLV